MATGVMNNITGKVNSQFNKVDYYLNLKNTNEQLVKDNERLRNMMAGNFTKTDTANFQYTDSVAIDTSGLRRKWMYRNAKVIFNAVTAPNNYIVLGRGAAQQMKKDEGVVDPQNGVVGIVTEVNDNYAVVMSLLHKDSKISAKLKKGGDAGQVVWDGKVPNLLTLTDIRKSAKVAKGDTVYTSGFTTTFPYGMMIGTVEEVIPDKSTNNYNIKLKSSANFFNLQYVYTIDNSEKEEVNKLLDKAKIKLNN